MTGLVHILITPSIFIKLDYVWEAILALGLTKRENVGTGRWGEMAGLVHAS